MANPFDQFDAPASTAAEPKAGGNPFDQFDAPAKSPPASSPQERSVLKTGVLAPFGTYPETYAHMQKESGDQVNRGLSQITEGKSPEDTGPAEPWNSASSLWARTKGAANVAFGALGGLGGNTIGAAARTFAGKPVENLTGIPKEYTEFAANLAVPGVGMTRVPRLPAGVPKTIPKAPGTGLSAEARANADLADEFGIKLSRGQAEKNLDAIRTEDMAARGAHGEPAQKEAAPFFEKQFEDIQQGGRGVGETLARSAPVVENPGQAGAVVTGEVADRADLARRAVERARQEAEAEAAAQRGVLQDQGRSLTEAVEGGHAPIAGSREAGEIVGQGVREQAASQRAGFRQSYEDAFSLPGQFHAGAFEGIGNRIQGRLTHGENPVIIDDVTTPVASRAIRDLDNISNLRIQNRADPFGAPNPENIVAVDLRGVDQARKRLVAYYQAARSGGNAADARAAGRLIDEFDGQIEHAISNGLFSGDPRALDALRQARAQYANYSRTFRPQGAGDDVGQAMRRIVDRNATPEEIANMVIGSGRLGNAGLPVRLADRLETVLGRDSEGWSAVRQALWQRASHPGTAAGGIDPARAAQSIESFAGSSLARRVFSPEELTAMRSHARGVRDLDNTIAQLPETQRAERVQNAYQTMFGGEGIGGAQATTFRRIIEGSATPEETANAVFGAIGSGNPGNVQRMIGAIERIVGANSDTMGAIRQGVWQKLTQNAAGKDQPGQQKVAQAVNEFINGKGASIARQLYTPQELALMKRYADAIKLTVIPKNARTNSDTAPAAMSALRKYSGPIMTLLGAGIDAVTGGYGVIGALAGKGTKASIEKPIQHMADRKIAKKIRGQFEYKQGGRITRVA